MPVEGIRAGWGVQGARAACRVGRAGTMLYSEGYIPLPTPRLHIPAFQTSVGKSRRQAGCDHVVASSHLVLAAMHAPSRSVPRPAGRLHSLRQASSVQAPRGLLWGLTTREDCHNIADHERKKGASTRPTAVRRFGRPGWNPGAVGTRGGTAQTQAGMGAGRDLITGSEQLGFYHGAAKSFSLWGKGRVLGVLTCSVR